MNFRRQDNHPPPRRFGFRVSGFGLTRNPELETRNRFSTGTSVNNLGYSGFRVANLANAISVQRHGDFTAEALRARSKEFLIKKYSELCELCASVVNTPSQETRKRHNLCQSSKGRFTI
jgi:hypothetical protein